MGKLRAGGGGGGGWWLGLGIDHPCSSSDFGVILSFLE